MNMSQPSLQQGFIGLTPVPLRPQGPLGPHRDPDALAGALDEIACGVIIVDANSKVLHSNLAAQATVHTGDCVDIVDGRLQTHHDKDSQSLNDALALAAQGKRSMITLGALSRTVVAVVPLTRQRTGNSPNTPRFALMFSRAGVCEALMLSFFARAYQLTPSEENILGLMCRGLTAPEMAGELRVGEATVRTHIRNICAKTHSGGIREVVKRLAVLPPLMAAVLPGSMQMA
jgi:DNA-binding CsgD family transcriptional regulator